LKRGFRPFKMFRFWIHNASFLWLWHGES
jgi:hypothetical protein